MNRRTYSVFCSFRGPFASVSLVSQQVSKLPYETNAPARHFLAVNGCAKEHLTDVSTCSRLCISVLLMCVDKIK